MKPNAELLKVPTVAWPTLLLAASALGTWVFAGLALHLGWLPWPLTLLLSSLAAYACFTPMHDATHRALGRDPRMHAVVGRLSALPLMGPYPAFRHLHLSHHRNTNDPQQDPDFWAGAGPAWQLPLRWLSQDLHYYARYLPDRSRPRAERIESIVTMVLFGVTAVVLLFTPWGPTVLLGWVLPARLATGFLAFSFDYLPHRPHVIRGRDDRFAATVQFRERWLGLLLLNQDHHLAHHLYPSVPFYRYHLVWRDRQAQLEARGARTVGLLDPSWWRDPLPDGRSEAEARPIAAR